MEDKEKKAKKDPEMVKCPGSCGKMIRADWGHACGVNQDPDPTLQVLREQRTELVKPDQGIDVRKVKVYIPEKDVEKRVDFLFVLMLTGLSNMLQAWGDMECKGGGYIDVREDGTDVGGLFHCKACVMNGIRRHVDQAIERWKGKL